MKKIKLIIFTTSLALAFFVSCSGSGSSRIKPPKLTVQTNGKNPFIIIQNPGNANQTVDPSSNSTILPVENYINNLKNEGQKLVLTNPKKEIKFDAKSFAALKENGRFALNKTTGDGTNTNTESWDAYLADYDQTTINNIPADQSKHTFYSESTSGGTTTAYTTNAELKAIGQHCYVWYKAKNGVDLRSVNFNEVATKFDSIYNKETYIFGSNIPSDTFKNDSDVDDIFIPFPSDTKIHIIIYDLQDDNNQGDTVEGGYFWSLDMYKNTYLDTQADAAGLDSNECECIHIDSIELRDHTAQAYSTLAHEFQHLLNFVNKTLNSLGNNYSASWYNEMMSMVCEDIMLSQLGLDAAHGPQNRLNLFNRTYQYGFTTWYSGNDVLVSYANAYAFGAFLLRNYGIDCIKEIAHNGYVNETSVLEAVQNYDAADPVSNFSELLQKFYNVMLSPEGNYYSLNKSVSKTYNISESDVLFTCSAINLNSYATIPAQEMTYDVASKLYNGVAGRTYYGPVILENTYYLDIAPKGTCIIHIPQSYSSVSIPGEWSDYLNYYIELK